MNFLAINNDQDDADGKFQFAVSMPELKSDK